MSNSTTGSETLPRTDFIATTVSSGVRTLLPCRDLWKGSALKDSVLNKTPMKKAKWATLFAYMHRRFGPPHIGGDDYKDLSAGWILTTPDADVFVEVSPSLSGTGFSFTPYLSFESPEDDRIYSAGDLALPQERVESVKNAYRDTLIDLLRPVCVRDHSINALGEIDDDNELLAYDEDKDESTYEIRFHPSSGYPMPPGLFGGEDWATMCTLILNMGNGDMAAGRSAVISLLQQQVINDASKATWPVQRLMLMGAWKDRSNLAQRLGLDSAAIERFEAEIAALHANDEPRDWSIVDEMTPEVVNAAVGYLKRLGFGACHLPDRVKQYRFDKMCNDAWNDLVEVVKDDFPADLLPENCSRLCKSLPEALKAQFIKHERQDLVSWVDRTISKLEGLGVLMLICVHLERTIKQQSPMPTPTA